MESPILIQTLTTLTPKRTYTRHKPREKETKPRSTLLLRRYIEKNPNASLEELKEFKRLYEKKVRYICSYAKKYDYMGHKRTVIERIPLDLELLKAFSVALEFKIAFQTPQTSEAS